MTFAMSKECQVRFFALKKYAKESVAPITRGFFRLVEGRKERWSCTPRLQWVASSRQSPHLGKGEMAQTASREQQHRIEGKPDGTKNHHPSVRPYPACAARLKLFSGGGV
jgi:hypothetical protein